MSEGLLYMEIFVPQHSDVGLLSAQCQSSVKMQIQALFAIGLLESLTHLHGPYSCARANIEYTFDVGRNRSQIQLSTQGNLCHLMHDI